MPCVGLNGPRAPRRACLGAPCGGQRRSRIGWLGAVSLVLLMGLSARIASAQDSPAAGDQSAKLEQAVKHVEQLNYPDARQLLFDVVRSGNATAEQLAQG